MACYKRLNKNSGIAIIALVFVMTLAWSNNVFANNCIDTSHKQARDALFQQSKQHQQNIQPINVRQQYGTPAKQISNIMGGGQSSDMFKNLMPQMQGGISSLLQSAMGMLTGIMTKMMSSMTPSNIFGSGSGGGGGGGGSCQSPTAPKEGDPR